MDADLPNGYFHNFDFEEKDSVSVKAPPKREGLLYQLRMILNRLLYPLRLDADIALRGGGGAVLQQPLDKRCWVMHKYLAFLLIWIYNKYKGMRSVSAEEK